MAKSKETFNKREKEKKKLKKRQEKEEKMQERKAGAVKGKALEEMMAYIDENGNLSSTPPDPKKKRVFKPEDMQISAPRHAEEQEETVRKGVVSFFNEAKGFGFINDQQTGERVFVHVNQLTERLQEGDAVSFEVEMGPRGAQAIRVNKL